MPYKSREILYLFPSLYNDQNPENSSGLELGIIYLTTVPSFVE